MLGLAGFGVVDFGARNQGLQDIRQHLRVGASRYGAVLRPAKLGGRNHLHGFGDLPRVDHAADTAADVENVGHESVVGRRSLVVSQNQNPGSLHCTADLFQVSRSIFQGPWNSRLQTPFYFATASCSFLDCTNCCFACLITSVSWAFRESSRIFFSMMVRSKPELVASTYS